MTIYLRKFLPLLALAALALGCKMFEQIQKKVEADKKPKVLASTDGKSQLTVPGSWSVQKDLNEQAVIQAANLRAEQYVVVLSESKEDFTDDFTLQGFTDLVRTGLAETIITPVFTEDQPLTIGGKPALQFEVSGTIENIKARWIYTIVGTPTQYHQIATWTLASKYEANKPVFLEVINSFRETDGSAVPPPPSDARP